jgi:hypothetical protein
MRRILILAVALATAAVPALAAPKPPKPPKGTPAITIAAKPDPVVFSSPVALTGRLSGGTVGGIGVKLQKDESAPYGDKYVDTAVTGTTAANGNYSFSVKPGLNTQYRVVAAQSPPVTSPGRLVLVRPRVGLRVAHVSGAVRFTGSVYPDLDGHAVLIQRRSPSGRFVTVARTTLRDAGTVYSTYAKRVTVSRDGVYRAKVPGDAKHVNGFSVTRTVTAG